MKTTNSEDPGQGARGVQDGGTPDKVRASRARIALLFGLCALGCMVSLWLIVSSLRGGTTNVMSISPIQVPAHVQPPADSLSEKANNQNLREIRRLVMYMDSLARSPGRHLYDSLLKAHPCLRENLDNLERFYPELSNEFLITK